MRPGAPTQSTRPRGGMPRIKPSTTSTSTTGRRGSSRPRCAGSGSARGPRSSISRTPGHWAISSGSSSTGSGISSDPVHPYEEVSLMSTTSIERVLGLNEFFAASEARVDRWRTLNRVARALMGTGPGPVGGLRRDPKELLAEVAPLEGFCAYPGAGLMAQVYERLQTGDRTGFARLVQRISSALLSNSYRGDVEPWKAEEESDPRVPDVLPPSVGRGQARRPYFEVLCVSPADRVMWPDLRETFRRLRRVEDEFVYEPVVVGNFEDAVLAVVFNPNFQAVVISDGFGYESQYTVPALREILTRQVQIADGPRSGDLGTLLARLVRRWRPELDVYLTTDRDVAELAGSAEAAPIRRIFYGVEEPMEIHLSILDGAEGCYQKPY